LRDNPDHGRRGRAVGRGRYRVAAFTWMLNGGIGARPRQQTDYERHEEWFLHNDARFTAAEIYARADNRQPAGAAENHFTIN
jgi:hypothetical protein